MHCPIESRETYVQRASRLTYIWKTQSLAARSNAACHLPITAWWDYGICRVGGCMVVTPLWRGAINIELG